MVRLEEVIEVVNNFLGDWICSPYAGMEHLHLNSRRTDSSFWCTGLAHSDRRSLSIWPVEEVCKLTLAFLLFSSSAL
jgi:hypothetical protein